MGPIVSDIESLFRGYSTRRHILEPERAGAVLPDRALCLPTFNHFLVSNKFSLSLSLSLSLPPGESLVDQKEDGMNRARARGRERELY